MSTIDCRTCRHASRDGCHSTVQCVDADQYKPTPTHQFWSRSGLMDLGSMLHTGAPAVPIEQMSISELRRERLTSKQVRAIWCSEPTDLAALRGIGAPGTCTQARQP